MILRKICLSIEREIPQEYKFKLLFCIRKIMKLVDLDSIISKLNATYFLYTDEKSVEIEGNKVNLPEDTDGFVIADRDEEGDIKYYIFGTRKIANDDEKFNLTLVHEFMHLISFKITDNVLWTGFYNCEEKNNIGINEVFTEYLAFYLNNLEIDLESPYYLGLLFIELFIQLGLDLDETISNYFANDYLDFRIDMLNSLNCNYDLLDDILAGLDELHSQYHQDKSVYAVFLNIIADVFDEIEYLIDEDNFDDLEELRSQMTSYSLLSVAIH